MKRWMITMGLMLAITAIMAGPALSSIFDDIGLTSKKGKKSDATKTVSTAPAKVKFQLYLTTGDVLKAVDFKGGTAGKSGTIRFISNFESDIQIKTPYLKYVDMDMIGDQKLEEEYGSTTADRVYLKNQDFLTGKVTGFTTKDVQIATSYGDVKAAITEVRYIMFRNSGAAAATEAAPATAQPSSWTPSSSGSGQ